MQSSHFRLRQYILVLGDFLLLYGALFTALFLRYLGQLESDVWEKHIPPFTFIFILWIIGFFIGGMYDVRQSKNTFDFFRRFFGILSINFLLAMAFFYIVPSLSINPKTNLVLTTVIIAIVFTLWRWAYNRFLNPRLLRTRVLFLGTPEESHDLIQTLHQETHLGYDVVALIDQKGHVPPLPPSVTRSTNAADLHTLIKKHHVNLVVLGMRMDDHTLNRSLYETLFWEVSFLDLVTFHEILTGRVPVSAVNEIWFLENLRESQKQIYNVVKRISDLVIALFLGTFFFITFPLIALFIFISSGRPVFYVQERMGEHHRCFRMIKYRTMQRDAEKTGVQFAKEDDTRVTRIGKILRVTRLDELPQWINVLRGDMSFIGPRPERPKFVRELEHAMPFYAIRHIVRPGMTGWAQINYPYAGTLETNLRKFQYDLFYIKNRSLILDLVILLRTINVIIRFQGR